LILKLSCEFTKNENYYGFVFLSFLFLSTHDGSTPLVRPIIPTTQPTKMGSNVSVSFDDSPATRKRRAPARSVNSSPSKTEPEVSPICLIPPTICKFHEETLDVDYIDSKGLLAKRVLDDFLPPVPEYAFGLTTTPQLKSDAKCALPGDPMLKFSLGASRPTHLPSSDAVGQFGIVAPWKDQGLQLGLNLDLPRNAAPRAKLSLENVRNEDISNVLVLQPSQKDSKLRNRLNIGSNRRWLSGGVVCNVFGDAPVDPIKSFKFGLWGQIRPSPNFTLGAQVGQKDIDIVASIHDPSPERPNFDLTLRHNVRGNMTELSYFQRYVLRRRVGNVFEDPHVTHIANNIDFAAKVNFDAHHWFGQVATGFQLTRNHMVKAKITNSVAQAAYIFRSWSTGLEVSAQTQYDFTSGRQTHGIGIYFRSQDPKVTYEHVSGVFEKSPEIKYAHEPAPEIV
jgi:hypothetical protein